MATHADLDADAAISALGLSPHPEGGWFAETWRHHPEDGSRGDGTAIYFLLREGESSHWHTVDAVEIWHHHAGAPLDLRIAESSDGPVRTLRLGPDLTAGERPQGIVPAGAWQAARPGRGRSPGRLHGDPGVRLRGVRAGPARVGARRRRSRLRLGPGRRPLTDSTG